MEMDDFYWPPAQAVLENACRNMLPTACIVCPCTSVNSALFSSYLLQLKRTKCGQFFVQQNLVRPSTRSCDTDLHAIALPQNPCDLHQSRGSPFPASPFPKHNSSPPPTIPPLPSYPQPWSGFVRTIWPWPFSAPVDAACAEGLEAMATSRKGPLLGILNVITKSRLSFLFFDNSAKNAKPIPHTT